MFSVVGQPEKTLRFRSGRPIYNEAGELSNERIMIVEPPAFDIASLVGHEISSKEQGEPKGTKIGMSEAQTTAP